MNLTDRLPREVAISKHPDASKDDHLADPLAPGDPLEKVQLKADLAPDGDVAHTAADGVSGSGEALPHLETIQASFGHHDVGGVRAHRDGSATDALDALDARGLTTGRDVALATDDLHTAAHEAAHTVQQEHGVALDRGVGTPGDAYERHADQVADKVVRGESAETLLDTMATGAPGVQRQAVQFSYNPGTGLYEDRPKKPSHLKGGDEVKDPLTAHHLYPWNKIRDDLNAALTEKSRSKMEKLIQWAEATVPDSFWDELEKDPQERSARFADQINQLAGKVCWSPSNIFMGPLNTKRGDDPNEGLDTAYAKRGLPTPQSALAELMSKRGGIGKVGEDHVGQDQEAPTLTEILMRNVRDASDGQARPYDAREWEDAEDDKRVRRVGVPLSPEADPDWKPSTKKFSDKTVSDAPPQEAKKGPSQEEIEQLRREAEERKQAKPPANPQPLEEDDDMLPGLFD